MQNSLPTNNFWDAFRPQFRWINTHGIKNANNPTEFHTLKGSYFCTSGLSLGNVILPGDESSGSLEKAKATDYSLNDLVGKVSLVVLCSAHPMMLRPGAVITGGNNSPGFPISDLANAKFRSKDNILVGCQLLEAIWLSLGICFPKNMVTVTERAASGSAPLPF